jgi:hypothetical protein
MAAVLGSAFAQTTQTTTTVNPDGSLNTFVTTNHYSWEDAAAAMALAKAFNMDPNAVVTMRGTTTTPYFDLAPAFLIANQSGKPFTDIMRMYNNGQTWMDIAKQLNVNATYFNPGNADVSNWTNTDFTNGVWQTILQNQYAMSPTDYSYFQSQAYPLNEVVVADVLANQSNRPVRDVYTSYYSQHDWPTVWSSFSQTNSSSTTNSMSMNNGSGNMGNNSNSNNNNNNNMSSATNTTNTTSTTPSESTQSSTSSSTSTMTTQPVPAANDTVPANHHTQTVAGDPIKEWQVAGRGPWTSASSRSSSFTLRRHHRHHRSRRHHNW